ncbi:MAG: hypothetical protein M0C28_22625 [Candidatus Moduliflexus flocculans]|nr:hypothetical protein [Candidatus Moduliflexus flocculans]
MLHRHAGHPLLRGGRKTSLPHTATDWPDRPWPRSSRGTSSSAQEPWSSTARKTWGYGGDPGPSTLPVALLLGRAGTALVDLDELHRRPELLLQHRADGGEPSLAPGLLVPLSAFLLGSAPGPGTLRPPWPCSRACTDGASRRDYLLLVQAADTPPAGGRVPGRGLGGLRILADRAVEDMAARGAQGIFRNQARSGVRCRIGQQRFRDS